MDSVIKETSPQGREKGDHKVKLRLGKAASEVFVSDPRRGGDAPSCGQRAARGFGNWQGCGADAQHEFNLSVSHHPLQAGV